MHFDSNILFLVLLGVAALIKWLAQKAQESGKKSDETSGEATSQSMNPAAPPGSEEERIRRFLEALGQPSSSLPPRKVTPRPAISPKSVMLPPVGPLPPLTTQPPPLVQPGPVATATLPPPLPSLAPPLVIPTPVETPAFEVRRSQPSSSSREPVAESPSANVPASSHTRLTTSSVLALLASADGLRQAVILREIFGPPRSLQE